MVLPVESPLVTDLMIPTATVCFISLTAKRPRGEYSLKVSTTIGLVGFNLQMEASPVLILLGKASRTLPDRLSIFERISVNLQAIWAVWQSRTGVYPFWMDPGWFMMMT